MHKIRTILMLIAMVATQQVFAADAADMSSSDDKSCSTIANACLAAGFVKTESADKGIWRDCMKPIILGQTVAGVTVDSSVVKACRIHKIKELKMELKEFQKSS